MHFEVSRNVTECISIDLLHIEVDAASSSHRKRKQFDKIYELRASFPENEIDRTTIEKERGKYA